MAKQKNYGYKTPVRRSTNNITGHKVGGDLSGGDCKVKFSKRLILNEECTYTFLLNSDDAIQLFKKSSCVVSIGGYFLPDVETKVEISIEIKSEKSSSSYIIKPNRFEKIGLAKEIDSNSFDPSTPIRVSITFDTNGKRTNLDYYQFSYGFVDYKYLVDNDVHDSFFNSKKEICYPEQFYFFSEIEFADSEIGNPFLLKSCNRCQRFLPINHFNEREQLSFSNHCSTKAPCRHGNFYNYTIIESDIDKKGLTKYFSTTTYKVQDNFIHSYYGHQLECKACKKFFVNSALNYLRTSTQHREDSLRRRAFELLIGNLLQKEWIYHSFRNATQNEFDRFIWEKFGRKCFHCDAPISTPNEMDLDHTMPLVFLYPLDETATCLCPTCNSEKSDKFPVEYYTKPQLEELSKLTGLDITILKSRKANQKVIDLLKENIVWFFEEFLTFEEYTKVREGKRAADSILHSLQKVVNNSKFPFDLLKEYDEALLST